VRVKEYPRWSHNQQHRRGVQYRVNGQRIVRNINGGNKSKGYQQIDKQRVLSVSDYSKKQNANKHNKSNVKRVKQALGNKQTAARQTKTFKANKQVNSKQRIINQGKNQQQQKLSNNHRPSKNSKVETKHRNSESSQKYASQRAQSNQQKRPTVKTYNKASTYKSNNKSSSKSNSYRASSNKQNKSRPVKVARQKSNSKVKQR
jgi:hypothetical protein